MNVEMDKVKTQKIRSKRNLFKLTIQKGKSLAKLNSSPSKATLLRSKTNKTFHEDSEKIEGLNGTNIKTTLNLDSP